MTKDDLLNIYHLDKLEYIERGLESHVLLHEKNGHILILPINIIDNYCHLKLNTDLNLFEKIHYLIQSFNYDHFIKLNPFLIAHDFYGYRLVIDRLRHRYYVLNKWKEIINKTNINKIYHNDIALLLERKFDKHKNITTDDNINDYIISTLIILSKIDLSKVEFTETKELCKKYTIKININPFDHYQYNQPNFKKELINSQITDLIIQQLNKIINEEGNIIIYDIISDIYQISDISFYNKSYMINNYMIGSKNARFAKVLKLKRLIDDSKNTQF